MSCDYSSQHVPGPCCRPAGEWYARLRRESLATESGYVTPPSWPHVWRCPFSDRASHERWRTSYLTCRKKKTVPPFLPLDDHRFADKPEAVKVFRDKCRKGPYYTPGGDFCDQSTHVAVPCNRQGMFLWCEAVSTWLCFPGWLRGVIRRASAGRQRPCCHLATPGYGLWR